MNMSAGFYSHLSLLTVAMSSYDFTLTQLTTNTTILILAGYNTDKDFRVIT